MSYCRFSSGDVYLYAHVGGGFECCACRLADLVKTIFTEGCEDHFLFDDIDTCEECGGEGCDHCMMNGNTRLETRTECLEHLQKHRDAGDEVPEYAFEALREELAEEGEINEPYFEDGYDGPAIIDLKSGTVKKVTDLVEDEDAAIKDRD